MKARPIFALLIGLALLAGTLLPAGAQTSAGTTQALHALVKIPTTYRTVPPLCVTVGGDETCAPPSGSTITVGGELELDIDYVLSSVKTLPTSSLRAGLGITCEGTNTGDGIVAALSEAAYKPNSLVRAVLTMDGTEILRVEVPVDPGQDSPDVGISWCG